MRRAAIWSLVAAALLTGLFKLAISASTDECGSHVSCPHDVVHPPPSDTVAPIGYRLDGNAAIAIADGTRAVRTARVRYPRLRARALLRAPHEWRISYVETRERARVLIDDSSGHVMKAETGPFAEREMLFYGYAVAWRRLLLGFMLGASALFGWLLVDRRRPLSFANLDVLAMLGWLVPLTLMTLDRQDIAVYLFYPPLLYLLGRLAVIGLARARAPLRRLPSISVRELTVILLIVVAARVALSLAFGFVTDEGYGGVLAANGIHHGWAVYSDDTSALDVYGPLTYLSYLPFELIFPMDPNWQRDYLMSAHAASIAFDLATMAALFLLGRRLARGDARGGLMLALAWATLPYTLFVLAESDNDALVAACAAGALLALQRPALRGALIGYGAAAKFAPLILLPLVAAGRAQGRRSHAWVAAACGVLVVIVAVFSYLPDGGLREFLDTTLLASWSGVSPFSIWDKVPTLGELRYILLAVTALAAAALFFRPRGRTLEQVAALGGALAIALQISRAHWLYPYVLWFAPMAIVALFGRFELDEDQGRNREAIWRPAAQDQIAA